EDAGGVRHADAAPRAGGNVDVVVSHRDVGDHAQVGAALEQGLVEPVHHGRHRAARALHALGELPGRPGPVLLVVHHFVAGAEVLDKFAKDSSCNNDLHRAATASVGIGGRISKWTRSSDWASSRSSYSASGCPTGFSCGETPTRKRSPPSCRPASGPTCPTARAIRT